MSIPLGAPSWKSDRPPFARGDGRLTLNDRPTSGVVARASTVTKDDGSTCAPAAGIAVDRRVLAVRPTLTDAEALTIDLVLKTYEAQLTATKAGVRVAADEIAAVLGVPLSDAAAIKSSLIGRGLLREARNGFGMPSGFAPCIPTPTPN